jgi:hypothetical protein
MHEVLYSIQGRKRAGAWKPKKKKVEGEIIVSMPCFLPRISMYINRSFPHGLWVTSKVAHNWGRGQRSKERIKPKGLPPKSCRLDRNSVLWQIFTGFLASFPISGVVWKPEWRPCYRLATKSSLWCGVDSLLPSLPHAFYPPNPHPHPHHVHVHIHIHIRIHVHTYQHNRDIDNTLTYLYSPPLFPPMSRPFSLFLFRTLLNPTYLLYLVLRLTHSLLFLLLGSLDRGNPEECNSPQESLVETKTYDTDCENFPSASIRWDCPSARTAKFLRISRMEWTSRTYVDFLSNALSLWSLHRESLPLRTSTILDVD